LRRAARDAIVRGMDKLLFLVCAVVLAATPAQGTGGSDAPKRKAEAAKGAPTAPAPQRERDSASTGSSTPERRRGTDLGYEAEKEEDEFLKKKRTAPLKAR
jgi:hypothetical protein